MTTIAGRGSPSPPLSSLLDQAPQADPQGTQFRTDIEGLRAVAILLIVGYHAGIPGFSGGFIGVDVFFVISGFLITRRLLSDTAKAGSVPFADFWSRRIRRLVPGLALMVVATLFASLLIINPFDMLETAKEGGASALYVSNILFAQDTQNYFGTNPNKSPFLHTWSLGVEEQFYLVWPFLVFGLLLFFRRRAAHVRKGVLVLFTCIAVGSFVLNVAWTDQGSAWAFFSLPTRAWEFAAGGFLGSVVLRRRRLSGLVGFVGLALIVVATETLDASTPYPGTAALLPVAGALLIILAGFGSGPAWASAPSRLLGVRPMRWIGRLSYSWYLWHWPFIVLAIILFNSDSTVLRSGAAMASLGVAYVAFLFVENPIRFSRWVTQAPRRAFVLGLAITAVTVGIAGGVWAISSTRTPTSFNTMTRVAVDNFYPKCPGNRLLTAPGGALYCFGGDVSSPVTVALAGDSHSATWFNTFDAIGKQDHLRILLLSNPGCPFIPVTVRKAPNGPIDTSQCRADRDSGLALVAKIKPAGIVLAEHSGQYFGNITSPGGDSLSQQKQVVLWQHAFRSFVTSQMAAGVRVGVILDNPELPETPAECVSQTGSISACEPTRAVALSADRLLGKAEQQVIKQVGSIPDVNTVSVLCNPVGCPIVAHGKLLYVDDNHLTHAATQLFVPQIRRLTNELVGPRA